MKTLFLAIQNTLQDIPGLKFVGEDWGQLNCEQAPENFPCLLIDLGDVEFSSCGQHAQRAEATLKIKVADVHDNSVTPALSVKQISVFDLLDEVNKRLHGYELEKFSKLCRVDIKKTLRNDAVREFVVTYKFAYTDTITAPVYQKVQARPQISI